MICVLYLLLLLTAAVWLLLSAAAAVVCCARHLQASTPAAAAETSAGKPLTTHTSMTRRAPLRQVTPRKTQAPEPQNPQKLQVCCAVLCGRPMLCVCLRGLVLLLLLLCERRAARAAWTALPAVARLCH